MAPVNQREAGKHWASGGHPRFIDNARPYRARPSIVSRDCKRPGGVAVCRLAAKGNDAERQAGLLIWRITRGPDGEGFPNFALMLPGPDDSATAQQRDRIVAWPGAKADRFMAKSELTAVLSRIRREGDMVFFEVGPKCKRGTEARRRIIAGGRVISGTPTCSARSS